MQGKQFTAINFCSSALIFSFCNISQVAGRCKREPHAAKASCINK